MTVLPGIRIKEGESFENGLKRFKKQCEKSGLLADLRKKEHFEKPSIQRKRKQMAARKRAVKKVRLMERKSSF